MELCYVLFLKIAGMKFQKYLEDFVIYLLPVFKMLYSMNVKHSAIFNCSK